MGFPEGPVKTAGAGAAGADAGGGGGPGEPGHGVGEHGGGVAAAAGDFLIGAATHQQHRVDVLHHGGGAVGEAGGHRLGRVLEVLGLGGGFQTALGLTEHRAIDGAAQL